MTIALAATQHDPDGRLYAQTARVLPRLQEYYSHILVVLIASTEAHTRTLLQTSGAQIVASDPHSENVFRYLGRRRRQAIAGALNAAPDVTHIHLCDFDRILHWVEAHPHDLRETLAHVSQHDFSVLGRTARAYASHPRVQRDTEAIINHAFSLTSGQAWDVSAASRGLSRRAAQAIVDGCHDDTLGTDCSWPLFLRCVDGLRISALETEGLEFETPDRFADEIAAAGGVSKWIARIDDDPRQWAYRLEVARIEVKSVVNWSDSRVVNLTVRPKAER